MPENNLPTRGHWDFGYTAIPDYFLDHVADTLTASELRVMLYIYRHTLGYRKLSDTISYSQFLDGITTRDGHRLDHGAGISRRSLVAALAGLEQKKLIARSHRGGYLAVSSIKVLIPSAITHPIVEALPANCPIAPCDPGETYPENVGNPAQKLGITEAEAAQQVQVLPAAHPGQVQVLPHTKDNHAQKIKHEDGGDSSFGIPGICELETSETNTQAAAVKLLMSKVPGISRLYAGRLVRIALEENKRDLAYLERLVDHVVSNPTIRVPAAVLTSLVKANEDRPPVTAVSDTRKKQVSSHREVGDGYWQSSEYKATSYRPPAAAGPIDFSKYTGDGKYAYITSDGRYNYHPAR